MIKKYAFDRPIIILAAPRSGSTLLFETLARSPHVCTIGGESHGVFESINRFNPLMGYCDSNALSADDGTDQTVEQLRAAFLDELRDANGNSPQDTGASPRLLEKTPKNALRVSLLNRVFPDALYVYLYRNPRENISSIMDAWESGRFVTYPSLLGREKPWSLLLPPGWDAYNEANLEDVAAFQWQSANTAILDELNKLQTSRWMAVSYGQQVQETESTVQRICEFADIPCGPILQSLAGTQPALSQYTLTAPRAGKWHRNAAALQQVLPGLQSTVDRIRELAPAIPEDEFDLSIEPAPRDTSSPVAGGSAG